MSRSRESPPCPVFVCDLRWCFVFLVGEIREEKSAVVALARWHSKFSSSMACVAYDGIIKTRNRSSNQRLTPRSTSSPSSPLSCSTLGRMNDSSRPGIVLGEGGEKEGERKTRARIRIRWEREGGKSSSSPREERKKMNSFDLLLLFFHLSFITSSSPWPPRPRLPASR